ncbi:MAG: ATP-binding protein [Oscillospiraceae bacterium]
MDKPLEKYKEVERSIIKQYRKRLWSPFTRALKQYQLVQKNDRIAVCISGGKDSMLLAKLMQELQKHSDVPFENEFLVMDPGYNAINRQKIEENAALLNIPITIFETDIFEVVAKTDRSPCYLCARMRRGYLYKNAQTLGCNKIALGHHYSDVVETTLMGMIYGAQVQTMMPKLHSSNYPGMQLIRPMYCIHEDNIIAWKNYHELEFIQCACRFTENCTICDNGGGGSKRQEVKQLIKRLKRTNPHIESNIFNSIHNVNLNTVIGYTQKGVEHSFLDGYDEIPQQRAKEAQADDE